MVPTSPYPKRMSLKAQIALRQGRLSWRPLSLESLASILRLSFAYSKESWVDFPHTPTISYIWQALCSTDSYRGIALSGLMPTPPGIIQLGGVARFSGLFRICERPNLNFAGLF